MPHFTTLLLASLLVVPNPATAQDPSSRVSLAVDSVAVTRLTVIGFFPPLTQSQLDTDETWSSALSQVQFALADARECLPRDTVDFLLVYATTLVILRPGSQPVSLSFSGDSAYGALLVAPGDSIRQVYPTAGPSALGPLLRRAAALYVHNPECDSRRE
jgi:hypothetical protein